MIFFSSFRSRSIKQCLETKKAFEKMYQEEEANLEKFQHRLAALEPIPNEPNQIRFMAKPVTVS